MTKFRLYTLTNTDITGKLGMVPSNIELTQEQLESHLRLRQAVTAVIDGKFNGLSPILIGEGENIQLYFYSHVAYTNATSKSYGIF